MDMFIPPSPYILDEGDMLRKLYAEVPSWACAESAVAKDIAIHMYVIRRLVMKFCAGVQ